MDAKIDGLCEVDSSVVFATPLPHWSGEKNENEILPAKKIIRSGGHSVSNHNAFSVLVSYKYFFISVLQLLFFIIFLLKEKTIFCIVFAQYYLIKVD